MPLIIFVLTLALPECYVLQPLLIPCAQHGKPHFSSKLAFRLYQATGNLKLSQWCISTT